MDYGELFKKQFRVCPSKDGSFIVALGDADRGLVPDMWGFSNIGDLIEWLTKHADQFRSEAGQGDDAS